jgi:hypothetical protein
MPQQVSQRNRMPCEMVEVIEHEQQRPFTNRVRE